MAFEENTGINKLANVLSDRMQKENASDLVLDFGEIQSNGSLLTNTFPVPVPKGDYSICRHVGGMSLNISGGSHQGHISEYYKGSHSHTVSMPKVKAGDRVLVAWVQNEAVVIDVIVGS